MKQNYSVNIYFLEKIFFSVKIPISCFIFLFNIIKNIFVGMCVMILVNFFPNYFYKHIIGLNKISKSNTPIFFVHGLLDFTSPFIINNSPTTIKLYNFTALKVGLIITDYERAIQVFYQIKGGLEDFGEDFVNNCNKYSPIKLVERYGRYHKGYHKKWNENNPINIILHGQSSGCAIALQQLLETNYYTGLLKDKYGVPYETNANWLKSCTFVAGAHNGTILPYLFGNTKHGFLTYESGDSLFCVANIAFFIIKFMDKIFKNMFDLAMDHRNMCSLRTVSIPQKNYSFMKSFEINKNKNTKFKYNPKTTYLHIMTSTTKPEIHDFYNENEIMYYPQYKTSPFLIYPSLLNGHTNLKTRKWRNNNGLISVKAQDIINPKYNKNKYYNRIINAKNFSELMDIFNKARFYKNSIIRYKKQECDHLQISIFGILFSPNIWFFYRYSYGLLSFIKKINESNKCNKIEKYNTK